MMKKRHYLFLLLLLTALLEFWHLGTQPIKEYDEARYAANAYEMMHNGDYLNLYYQGQPDTWVARPPLKAWLIIGGYKLLGYNEWGLRLSSGIAVLIFFFFAFQLINLYLPSRYAFLCGLMLLTVKGIIGFHVGRNADMDAELIALLTAFTYFFLRYLDFKQTSSAVWAGLFLGLCFWMKTTACFYYIPGLVLYTVVTSKFKTLIRDRFFWIGVSLFICIVSSWLLLLSFQGCKYHVADSYHEYDSQLKTMLFYDTWDRFTASSFDKHPVEPNYVFFIHSIDSLFNVWNYFFYAGVILYFVFNFHPKLKSSFRQSDFYRPCTLALCVALPIALLLTFGMHKLPWYTSPTLLWLSIPAVFTVHVLSQRIPYFFYVLGLVFLFTLIRHFVFLQDTLVEKNEVYFIKETRPVWQSTPTIYYVDPFPQNVYVYLMWQGKSLRPVQKEHVPLGSLVLLPADDFNLHRKRLLKIAQSDQEKHHKELVWAKVK